jgi:hypothetical protein
MLADVQRSSPDDLAILKAIGRALLLGAALRAF